jgi:hypothetical protein
MQRPLSEVPFGVYLTLLGAVVIVSAVLFERRREEVLRWADSVRSSFDSWS